MDRGAACAKRLPWYYVSGYDVDLRSSFHNNIDFAFGSIGRFGCHSRIQAHCSTPTPPVTPCARKSYCPFGWRWLLCPRLHQASLAWSPCSTAASDAEFLASKHRCHLRFSTSIQAHRQSSLSWWTAKSMTRMATVGSHGRSTCRTSRTWLAATVQSLVSTHQASGVVSCGFAAW